MDNTWFESKLLLPNNENHVENYDKNTIVLLNDDKTSTNSIEYCKIFIRFQHLNITHPKLSHSINKLVQFIKDEPIEEIKIWQIITKKKE